MRVNRRLSEYLDPAQDTDPRESAGAEVIDLATRNVLPQVAQRKPRSDAMGLAVGVAVVALLGGVTLWSMNNTRTTNSAPHSQSSGQAVQSPAPFPDEIAPAVPPQAITPLQESFPAEQEAVTAAPPQSAAQPNSDGESATSPTVVYDSSSLPMAPAAPGQAPEAAGSGAAGDDFASRVGGVGGGAATATASFDPRTTVTQGTLIPAVLETAINTDVPGYVRAVVSTDVRSFDGKSVLVPRSSRLIGQYKSGLQAGQKRAYVIWSRLIRPDGVTVNLASPAIAFSGETGLPGKVNTHFFERFGSALLLSVVSGLSAIGGNTGILVAGGGQSAASAAVGQTGSIAPTIRVRQGEPIRVFAARDLDFSQVTKQ